MTAPESAVERAARALYEHDYRPDPDPWEAVDSEVWDEYRALARAALAAAGLGETTVEWGVKWPYRSRQPERVTTYRDRVAAEDAIKRQGRIYPGDGPGFLLRREVTPGEVTEWHEVLS